MILGSVCVVVLGDTIRRHHREYGNKHLEDSSSSDSWNSFKRQVVSCIRRAHDVIGPFFLQEQTMNGIDYLNMLELFAVPQMAHFQADVFF
jgi:hypothetical protein